MKRSDYYSPKTREEQRGWDTTSHDYHSHILRLERMPSVLTDVPHYPNVHKVFNRNIVNHEGDKKKQQQSPKFQDKVEVIEYQQDHNNGKKGQQDCIDSEADGFIQRKHKGFELCKWATFKVN